LIVWIDAQLTPYLAPRLEQRFGIEAHAVRDLGLRDAKDRDIFRAAGAAGVVVMTKDADFAELLARLGPPPQVLWLTCGNTSNAFLRQILLGALPLALETLARGEPLVEISGSPSGATEESE
jgi:predicted nuclease of predicted toxin-antitoxin system